MRKLLDEMNKSLLEKNNELTKLEKALKDVDSQVQSNPLIPPILGLAKSGSISKTVVLGVKYNLQNPYLGRAAVLSLEGWPYWEGGGIGREAVLGGWRYWEGGGIGRVAVLGGWRYWEGGGIGRVAVLGESVLGGWRYWEGGGIGRVGIGRVAVLGGWRYWEGGRIGRVAVLGGRQYWEGGVIGRVVVLEG